MRSGAQCTERVTKRLARLTAGVRRPALKRRVPDGVAAAAAGRAGAGPAAPPSPRRARAPLSPTSPWPRSRGRAGRDAAGGPLDAPDRGDDAPVHGDVARASRSPEPSAIVPPRRIRLCIAATFLGLFVWAPFVRFPRRGRQTASGPAPRALCSKSRPPPPVGPDQGGGHTQLRSFSIMATGSAPTGVTLRCVTPASARPATRSLM